MSGVIEGGWPYVWAAYVVSAVILTGYVATVLARYWRERRNIAHQ